MNKYKNLMDIGLSIVLFCIIFMLFEQFFNVHIVFLNDMTKLIIFGVITWIFGYVFYIKQENQAKNIE